MLLVLQATTAGWGDRPGNIQLSRWLHGFGDKGCVLVSFPGLPPGSSFSSLAVYWRQGRPGSEATVDKVEQKFASGNTSVVLMEGGAQFIPQLSC